MSDLIVIGFDSHLAADAARADLLAAATELAWEIEDAMIAKANDLGSILFHQMADVWAIGASGGGMWGVLAGMLFADPPFSGQVGGLWTAPEAQNKHGIDSDAMSEIAVMLLPGLAAFFLLINSNLTEAMIDRLAGTGTTIMRTRLEHPTEHRLRQLFARATPEK